MMISRRLLLIVANVLVLARSANGQQQDYDYEDYSQDSLYADYARQQQLKEAANP